MAWDPDKHPRGPDGRFIARGALTAWVKKGAKGGSKPKVEKAPTDTPMVVTKPKRTTKPAPKVAPKPVTSKKPAKSPEKSSPTSSELKKWAGKSQKTEPSQTTLASHEKKAFESLKKVVDKSPPGALINVADVRKASRMSKENFDRAMVSLYRQDKIAMHYHDFVGSLSQKEKDALVHDPKSGVHYIGATIRKQVAAAPPPVGTLVQKGKNEKAFSHEFAKTVWTEVGKPRAQEIMDRLWKIHPRFQDVLKSSPIDHIALLPTNPIRQIDDKEAAGLYFGDKRMIKLNAAAEWGKMTVIHEVGHHIHFARSNKIDHIIEKAYKSSSSAPINTNASLDKLEYFAENFVAYHNYRDELQSRDPVGHKMIEDVLEALK